MAEALGKKLLEEVEVVGSGEILHELRLANGTDGVELGIGHVDRLLKAVGEARSSTAKFNSAGQPLVEIHSVAPGSGSTHLLYYLTAIATLPRRLGGQQAAVAFIDTDCTYSAERHTQVMKSIIDSHQQLPDQPLQDTIKTALTHIHVFRPQSFASLLTTLETLPTYFLQTKTHPSENRSLALLTLDSASTFHWQEKSRIETATFLASTTVPKTTAKVTNLTRPQPETTHVQTLSRALKSAASTLQTPIILTTHNLTTYSNRNHNNSLNYSNTYHTNQHPTPLPPPLPGLLPTLRLTTRRSFVPKFPPGSSVEQALREAGERLAVVEEGGFECWDSGRELGEGFGFWVRETGVGGLV